MEEEVELGDLPVLAEDLEEGVFIDGRVQIPDVQSLFEELPRLAGRLLAKYAGFGRNGRIGEVADSRAWSGRRPSFWLSRILRMVGRSH